MKKLTAVVVAIVLLLSFSVSVMAKGFDLDAAIASFEEDAFNTAVLKVGATDQPQAYIWAQNGGKCYTSDASVVTVAADGTVTAVGSGTAYVAMVAPTGMYQVYRYDVTAKQKPATSKPVASEPAVSAPSETPDPDDTVSNNTVSSAPEKDDTTTIGAISSENTSNTQNEKGEEIKNKSQKIMDFSFGMFNVLIVIFAVIFLGVIVFFVVAIIHTARRPKPPKSPPCQTDHTPICPDCNCVLPAGATECHLCGRKL